MGAAKVLVDGTGSFIGTSSGSDGQIQLHVSDSDVSGTLVELSGVMSDIKDKDFATEATLLNLSSSLETITEIDFSTEATLQSATGTLESINSKDFATEQTLSGVSSSLDIIKIVDFATEASLNSGLGAVSSSIDYTRERLSASLEDNRVVNTLENQTLSSSIDHLRSQSDFNSLELSTSLKDIHEGQTDGSQLTQLVDDSGNKVTVTEDAGVYRIEIQGKVQTIGAIPPPATTPVRINADTPLTVGDDDTIFTIPDGEVFHLQQITAGNEDPTKGSVVEVIFDDGSEHLIERVYTSGHTIAIGFTDIEEARDGTSLLGNSGGTSDIIVRRMKYTGTDIAIDAEILGYTV